jgi:viroplasmin and RNaseH domain-containing protein
VTKIVQALVEIDENTNRVLNIVKAKYGLKDKGEAIELVITEYIEYEGEPELRPEFIKKMKEIKKQRSIKVNDFAKRYGLKNS